jgi:hypothetical protein
MRETNIPYIDMCALGIYVLINSLFVYKYVYRITSQYWIISLLYLVVVSLVAILLVRRRELRIGENPQNTIYFSISVILAALLIFLMLQFDPQKIRVGRYPALHDWITRLFHSEFPYNAETNPSGFPFLFVIAMPFYFLDDLGFLQILGFLILVYLIYLRHREDGINRFKLILLLITAPIFVYEVIVRSDLVSNMVIVMVYLAIFESIADKTNHFTSFLLGLFGGFLLSTRGIVLLVYIPFFGFQLKEKFRNSGWFFLSMLIGFLLTLLPFLIWNWRFFWDLGPFARQLTQIPKLGVILSVACSIYCAIKIRSLIRIYSAISFILFGVVAIAFLFAVIHLGWEEAVLKDGFDISYFSFVLPFLLISLDLSKSKRIAQNNRVFSFAKKEPK